MIPCKEEVPYSINESYGQRLCEADCGDLSDWEIVNNETEQVIYLCEGCKEEGGW